MSPNRSHRPFAFACLVELLLLFLGVGLILILRVSVLEWLHWRASWILIGVLGTVPILGVLIWLMNTMWEPVIEVRRILDEVIGPFLGRLSVSQLLLLAILAGVAEEFFFRAFLQIWLSEMFNPIAGLILASLVFGACHWVTWFYGVYAAAMGLYLGALMMVTGSVWPSVIVHALYDFVAFIWLLKTRKGQ